MTTGYWVQDLPISSDPNPPPTVFDPAQPFEFSFWLDPTDRHNAVSLVEDWDRGNGCYINLFSIALTATASGGFLTDPVVGNQTLSGAPVVTANGWNLVTVVSHGSGQPVDVTIDGVKLSRANLVGSKTCTHLATRDGRVSILLGETGGPNSKKPTNVLYDDVYLGAIAADTDGCHRQPSRCGPRYASRGTEPARTTVSVFRSL